MFLTTKIPNPNYLPEIFIKVNVINFTVTFEGLDEQLLADVVKKERRDVEDSRDSNVQKLAKGEKSIKISEDKVLRLLAEAKAETILDKDTLINELEIS